MRVQLTIEYDGGPFRGWQRVDEGPSVQAALEDAFARIYGAPIAVHGAGRTDAGVHALAQVAHADTPDKLTPFRIAEALNAQLRPDPIAVLACARASDAFHARFSAVARAYRYRIVNRRADLALDAGRAWRLARPLDAEAMHAAAQVLVGAHDFTTFRDAQCQANSPVKTLSRLSVARAEETLWIDAEAPSFLHRQVRSIVGALAQVGLGRFSAADLAAILAARDRALCPQVAPACGLYLARVDYPADV